LILIGAEKNIFGADFYFDDQTGHCENTSEHVATGHVPHGIINENALPANMDGQEEKK
jgi:hypothetical protein